MITRQDLDFIVAQQGSLDAAIAYCEGMAAQNGPLSRWYAFAAECLRARREILAVRVGA